MARITNYAAAIRQLPNKERWELTAIGRDHLVRIAEQVGQFSPPFEWLRTELAGFDSDIRFILNCCEKGDTSACALRDALARKERAWSDGGDVRTASEAEFQLRKAFFAAHAVEFDRFVEFAYPWTAASGLDERRYVPHPGFDDLFADAVLGNLGQYGFRRLARTFKSTILGRGVEIRLDKGTWSLRVLISLEIPSLAHCENLAMPFFFSRCDVDRSAAADVQQQLGRLFGAYRRMFPTVLDALQALISDEELWLAKRRIDPSSQLRSSRRDVPPN